MAKIKVCGTSANLGPAFDTIGAALKIYSEIIIEELDEGFDFQGYKNKNINDNLIFKAVKYYFEFTNYTLKGLRIIEKSNIPSARGLGSSAACIVAGIAGGMLIVNNQIDKELLLNLATQMEGHPDNVAPAIYGGIVAAIETKDGIICNSINRDENLKFFALVPNFKLETIRARAALPKELPYHDAVFNIGRTAILVSDLINNKYENLKHAMDDKIHQNYRRVLIENYDKIFEAAYHSGAKGVYLSGAGPTIMVIATEDIYEIIDRNIGKVSKDWSIIPLSLDMEGIIYE